MPSCWPVDGLLAHTPSNVKNVRDFGAYSIDCLPYVCCQFLEQRLDTISRFLLPRGAAGPSTIQLAIQLPQLVYVVSYFANLNRISLPANIRSCEAFQICGVHFELVRLTFGVRQKC